MNIGELLEKIQGLDPSTLVVLARDEEGNGFMECEDVGLDYAFCEGEAKPRTITEELRKVGWRDEDAAGSDFTPCVVLWP